MRSEYFDKAIMFTLDNEDWNWRHNPKLENLNDGAGWTFIGITQRDDEKYLPFGLTVQTLADIYINDVERRKEMLEIINDIYFKKYWKPAYDQIQSYIIACRLFDFGVNRGIVRAVQALQNACNVLMPGAVELKVDGVFGDKTLNRVNSLIKAFGEDKLYNAFVYQCRKQYSAIVDRNPNMGRFYQGWINRLERKII